MLFLFVAERWGGDGEFGCEVASGGLLPLSCHIPQVFVLSLGFPYSRITLFGLGCGLWQWPGRCGGMCSSCLLLFLPSFFLSWVCWVAAESGRWFHELLELAAVGENESSINGLMGLVDDRVSASQRGDLIVGGSFVERTMEIFLSCQAFHHSWW